MPRVRQSQRPCASRQKRTRRGNGGSHPSCVAVSLAKGWVSGLNAHLVVENLGLARLGLGNEGLVEDVQNILADLLELGLDLLAVVADGANVLLRALGLLLLLDRGDDAPRGTSCADDVLVGDGQEVALVNGELTADLHCVRSSHSARQRRCGSVELAQHADGVGIP